MIHVLDCSPEHYSDLSLGIRTCDMLVSDRPFNVGDSLVYHEISGEKYTGRCVEAVITHIYGGSMIAAGHLLLHFQIIFPDSGPKIPIKTYMELLKNYNDLSSELEKLRSE